MNTLNRLSYIGHNIGLMIAWVVIILITAFIPAAGSLILLVGILASIYLSILWIIRRCRHINPDNTTGWVIGVIVLNMFTGIGGTLLLWFVPGSDGMTKEMLTITKEKHEMEKEKHEAWRNNQ